jgi:hypothetical protein
MAFQPLLDESPRIGARDEQLMADKREHWPGLNAPGNRGM